MKVNNWYLLLTVILDGVTKTTFKGKLSYLRCTINVRIRPNNVTNGCYRNWLGLMGNSYDLVCLCAIIYKNDGLFLICIDNWPCF